MGNIVNLDETIRHLRFFISLYRVKAEVKAALQ